MRHLLVTNDFPPKIGGIQSLLWEWWRRLPPESFAVLTSPYAGSAEFDARQPFEIRRTREPVLLPHPWMVRRIDDFAREFGADFVVLDPAVPLGIVGPALELPYMTVLHGAEVTVPGRLPVSKQVLGTVLPSIFLLVAAFLLQTVMTRHIGLQREQIAALKALGYDNRRIGWHYLRMVGVIVGLGCVLGVALVS